MDSFYMLLASNACTDLFPQNTLVNFKNAMPQEINATGYKVALQSISLDSKFGNVPNSVLGTKNHFLLFLDDTHTGKNATPARVYNITDFTLSPPTFARNVTKGLSSAATAGRVQLSIGRATKIVQFALNKCVLLVHSEVNKMLNIVGAETFTYLGEEYKLLSSVAGSRNFFSVKELPRNIITPRIVKVQLEELSDHVGSVQHAQDLAIIRVVKPTQSYPFYNVCKRKEYFELTSGGRLTTLSVRLVDENNFPLQLGSGQPTFLKLQLKKFPMDSTVLRLSSLESAAVFADNKNNSFRIQLQRPLQTSHWDVALSSIFLPSKPNIEVLLTAENFFIELPTATGMQRLTLHHLRDFTVGGFLAHINATVAAAFPQPPITVLLEGQELYIQSNGVDITVNISTMLAYLLSKNPSPEEPAFLPIKLDSNSKKHFGILDFKKLHPHVVLVYCNFISSLVVGGSYGQVLQIIPYYNSEADGDDIMKYEAQHLDFHPLCMNDRATLQFEIRNSAGDLVQFENDTSEILLTLVLREKHRY
jgi:hypothetical protein